MLILYPSYFKLHVRWLRYLAHLRVPRPAGAAASSVQTCLWQICQSPESLT